MLPRCLVLTAVLLLPGCLVQEDERGDRDGSGRDFDDEGRAESWGFDLGDLEDFEGRTQQVLGERRVGIPGPVSEHPLKVEVPAGGAIGVEWRIQLSGANVDTYVEGPHCLRDGIQVGGLGAGTTTFTGTCDDLPEGTYGFNIVHTAGAMDVHATVHGFVLD